MKTLWAKWTAVLFALSLLAACGGGGSSTSGGGGGGADTVTLTSGATTTVYTETYASVPFYSYDPYIYANYFVSVFKTYLYCRNGYTSGSGYNELLEIDILGNSQGPYTISGGTYLYYTSATPYHSFIASSGTVTVTRYDAVGGHIQGTFLVSNGTNTTSGTFYVTRGADQ